MPAERDRYINRSRPPNRGSGSRKVSGGLAKNQNRLPKVNDQAYLDALGQALMGAQQAPDMGGMQRSYVGGGGGGGYGGGPSAYDQWRIAEEKRRREELEKQKRAMELALGGQRKASSAAIGQQQHAALRSITNAYNENKAATRQTSGQLRQLGQNMVGGARNELAALQRDMRAQGGGGADMSALRGAAQANITGNQFLQSNADAFNTRLAQVQGGAKADAVSAAGMIRQGGLGDLENAYLQALMQIKMLGLA